MKRVVIAVIAVIALAGCGGGGGVGSLTPSATMTPAPSVTPPTWPANITMRVGQTTAFVATTPVGVTLTITPPATVNFRTFQGAVLDVSACANIATFEQGPNALVAVQAVAVGTCATTFLARMPDGSAVAEPGLSVTVTP